MPLTTNALPILKSGYCWRGGNGSSIRVQEDRWIPINHPTNKILFPANEDIGDLLVSDLIDIDRVTWVEKWAYFRFVPKGDMYLIPLSGFTTKKGYSLWNLLTRQQGKFWGVKNGLKLQVDAWHVSEDMYWMEEVPTSAMAALYKDSILWMNEWSVVKKTYAFIISLKIKCIYYIRTLFYTKPRIIF